MSPTSPHESYLFIYYFPNKTRTGRSGVTMAIPQICRSLTRDVFYSRLYSAFVLPISLVIIGGQKLPAITPNACSVSNILKMAYRTKICDQGGIFNASRPSKYSAETHKFLNGMIPLYVHIMLLHANVFLATIFYDAAFSLLSPLSVARTMSHESCTRIVF